MFNVVVKQVALAEAKGEADVYVAAAASIIAVAEEVLT